MNNTFNFNRFSLLLKRQWIENKKLFLMASVILLGLGSVFYLLLSNWRIGNIDSGVQAVTFMTGIFIGGTLFTNYIFKDFADKNSTTSFLLTPASHLEKLLSGSFYCLIIFPIVFIALYFMMDYFFVTMANTIHQNLSTTENLKDTQWSENVPYLNQYTIEHYLALSPQIGAWFITQAFMVLGTITFSRWAYIKTGFVGFVIMLMIGIITNYVFEGMIAGLEEQAQTNNYHLYPQIMPTQEWLRDITIFILKYIFTPLLLLIAYFKLKEKQV
jgi:hypothetical protein